MNNLDLFLKPVVTEKATASEKASKYLFFVRKDATKIAIKSAFKQIYGVDAVKVNVMRTPGKTKMGRSRMPTTKKREFKKVIITTKSKKVIDPNKPKIK